MKNKVAALLLSGTAFCLSGTPSAIAAYTQIDLSPYVNLGFENSWFINGPQFAPIVGSTTGNQGSGIPFTVASVPDPLGNGGNNNFWFGLYGGPGNQLFGSPLSVTIPVGVAATTVYTLADNTFGLAGNNEFSITFNPAVGAPFTEFYVGGDNTKDYNLNCGSTGCDVTPNAQDRFIDADNSQWLQVVAWTLPVNFGTLDSVTITQLDGSNGAIFAGLTVATAAVPEPETYAMMLAGLGLLGFTARRRKQNAA